MNRSLTSAATPFRDLLLASALFLFLELALIRWLPAQVLYLTFFTNTVLLASFLGLSLGCLAARRRTDWLALAPALLVTLIAAASAMEWIRLKLQNVIDLGHNAASPQVVYFGAELRVGDVASFVLPIELVAGLFFLLAALAMVGPGQLIGRCFAALPKPVTAYAINIVGSLAGILAFSVCSWWLPPVWWFAIVAVGLIYFLLTNVRRNLIPIGLAVLAPLLLIPPQKFGLGIIRTLFPTEIWSPYYRINYLPNLHSIVANLISQQTMISRNDRYPPYAIPYLLNRDSGQPQFHDILIIGAGSGNDVSRALQWGATDVHIDAVEIDPVIQDLGRRDHPDRPYQDPRVLVHVGDGRNFLRSTSRKYDLIVFALVDSLVLHSSVSNLRLESYVFTRESLEDVRRRLKPDGLFIMYNYFRQGWIVSRLAQTATHAFGHPPMALTLPYHDRVPADSKADAFTMLFEGPRAQAIDSAFEKHGFYYLAPDQIPSPSSPSGFEITPEPRLLRFSPASV
jgi:SAM-dependent methyltransferase